MEILTPCRSETAENIETKIRQNDYVMGPFHHANFRRNRSKGVHAPYSWNITLNCVIPSLPFPFLFSCRRLQQKRLDRFSRSIPQTTRLHPRTCLLRVSMRKKIVKLFRLSKPHNTPQVGVVRRFQAKRKKNWIFNIFEPVSQINTKFDRTLKTVKAPSWVVP